MRGFTALLVISTTVGLATAASAEEDSASLKARLVELYNKGDHAEAAMVAERSFERTLGRETTDTANALGGLAKVFYDSGNYESAEPLFKRALAIDEKALGPDHPDVAIDLNNLAAIYASQGRFALAEPLYKRSLAIREKTRGPDHAEVALAINNLAGLYQAQGLYAQAEPLFERALRILEKSPGSNQLLTAGLFSNLAAVHDKRGEYALAESLYKRALAIYEKTLGPDHRDTATCLNNLAFVHKLQGQYGLSESLYKRTLASREKALGPDHPDTAQSLNNLAVLYAVQGKYTQAEPLYKRAAAILARTPGPDHPSTLRTFMGLATLEAARGRFPAAAELADRARHGARRHAARVLPVLSASEQTAFLKTQDEGDYHTALTIGLVRNKSPEIARLSAGWLANGKAVGQEAASQRIILARHSQNPSTSEAVAGLERARSALAKLSQLTPKPDEAAAYRTKLGALQTEEHRLIHEIGGQLAALDREEPWVEIDEIRKNIPAGSVLVDIARFDTFDFAATGRDSPWQPPRYAAWIVPPAGRGDVTILDLGEAKAIDSAVAAYREAIEAVQKNRGAFPRGQAMAEDELKITAAPLTTKVFQPIVDALGTATEVILSPDGSLWLVPWQALPLADGSYAIEKFCIRTVTSGRDLVPVPVEEKGVKGASVVVADPAFDAAPAVDGSSSDSRAASPGPSSKDLVATFKRLPGTRAEALATNKAIAKLAGTEPRMLLGTDASEANVRQAAVRPKSLVLATHGFFKPDQQVNGEDAAGPALRGLAVGSHGLTRAVTTTGRPLEDPLLRCGLALAGANVGGKSGGDDGILTGVEIVGLDLLGTELVVLSACETGVGKVQNGEGVAGLRQAFQIAGAKSVVATLWQVPDRESAQLMSAFYANLAKGEPASQALREAQLAFIRAAREDRAGGEAAHPYRWAAYGATGR